MTLNVNRSDDAFYRYKMPRLLTKIEGKGNGIKTVIVNMSDIAKALGRKPSYPTKFFGIECGAQVQIDDKNDRYIVNGVHEQTKLQELIYDFIKKFVLCDDCNNPETVYIIKNKKSGIVGYRCKACGKIGEITKTHRLTQFIVKNPPDPDPEETQGDEKPDEPGNSDSADENDNDMSMGACGDLDDVPEALAEDTNVSWSVDASENAAAERIKALNSATQRLTMLDDEQEKCIIKTESERGDTMHNYVKSAKEKAGAGNPFSEAVVSELLGLKEKLQLRESGLLCFVEGLLSDSSNVIDDIRLYRPLFFPLTRTEKAQRYLIGGFELLISAQKDKLLNLTPKILHAAYNEDLLDEVIIDSWYSKGASKRFVDKKTSAKILDKSKPFIQWLKEAEEESDSEEEPVQNLPVSAEPTQAEKVLDTVDRKAAAHLDNDDESDVDIDDL